MRAGKTLVLLSLMGLVAKGEMVVLHPAASPPLGYSTAILDTNWADALLVGSVPQTANGDSVHIALSADSRIAVSVARLNEVLPMDIHSGSLHLYLVACDTRTSLTWKANLVSAPWLEQEVTWSNRMASVPWSANGGDYDSSLEVTGTIECIDEGYHSFDIGDLLEQWSLDTGSYAGILIRTEDQHGAAPVYMAKDNGTNDACQQPFIAFVPEPAWMPLVAAAMWLLAPRLTRYRG